MMKKHDARSVTVPSDSAFGKVVRDAFRSPTAAPAPIPDPPETDPSAAPRVSPVPPNRLALMRDLAPHLDACPALPTLAEALDLVERLARVLHPEGEADWAACAAWLQVWFPESGTHQRWQAVWHLLDPAQFPLPRD